MARRIALVLTVVLAAAGSACASDEKPSGARGNARVVTVEAKDNRFDPTRIEIDVGTTVRWENVGRNSHNVLQIEGDDFGVKTSKFRSGKQYTHRFDTPGTFSYWCSLHGSRTRGMIGRVVVARGHAATSTTVASARRKAKAGTRVDRATHAQSTSAEISPFRAIAVHLSLRRGGLHARPRPTPSNPRRLGNRAPFRGGAGTSPSA